MRPTLNRDDLKALLNASDVTVHEDDRVECIWYDLLPAFELAMSGSYYLGLMNGRHGKGEDP